MIKNLPKFSIREHNNQSYLYVDIPKNFKEDLELSFFFKEKDGFKTSFEPFDTYSKQEAECDNGIYRKIQSSISRLFGIGTAVILLLILFMFASDNLGSIDIVVAIFGSYFIAKDFWADIDLPLTTLTRNLPIRFNIPPYQYIKEPSSTSLNQLELLRKDNVIKMLPWKYSLKRTESGQILKLLYEQKSIKSGLFALAKIVNFEKNTTSVGAVVKLTKNTIPFTQNYAFTQIIKNQKIGAIDFSGTFQENAVTFEIYSSISRLQSSPKVEIRAQEKSLWEINS